VATVTGVPDPVHRLHDAVVAVAAVVVSHPDAGHPATLVVDMEVQIATVTGSAVEGEAVDVVEGAVVEEVADVLHPTPRVRGVVLRAIPFVQVGLVRGRLVAPDLLVPSRAPPYPGRVLAHPGLRAARGLLRAGLGHIRPILGIVAVGLGLDLLVGEGVGQGAGVGIEMILGIAGPGLQEKLLRLTGVSSATGCLYAFRYTFLVRATIILAKYS